MKSIHVKNNLFPLLKLAIPLAFSGIIQSSVFFFETIFLARLGKEVLAAGALVSWLFSAIIVIFWGTLNSINILIAYKHGSNNHQDIPSIMRDGLFMAILFAIPIACLLQNMAPIFLFFGQSHNVVVLAQSYLHALAWGVVPNFIMIAILELVIGLGQARIVMFFSMLSVFFTIFSSYILIFGKLGFIALGIAGAGWGMVIGNIVTCFVLILYIFNKKQYRHYFNSIFIIKTPYFLPELIGIGLPMGLMYCTEVSFFFALSLMMGSLGTVFLAANQIAMQYLGFFISVIFSFAQAITVRMGHLLGAKEVDAAKQTAYLGVSTSAIFMLFVALIFWCFPSYLIAIDFNVHENRNQELVYYTLQLLMITPLFQIVEAIRISLFGVLRALKDT